jgi:NADH-quinone oxidoreductase subunit M
MMASELASFTTPWLSCAIFVPIVCGLLILAVGSDERPALTRNLSLIGALLSFFVTIPLYTGFDSSTAAMQFVEKSTWIPAFAVMYHLGVDGISLWFVLLTAFITIIVVLAGWEVITSRIAQYMAAFLILSGLMIGVFVAMDGLLFYIFFEATLIPMYIIVGVWGGPNRVYAAFKFFLYTLMGSLLTLVAFLYLWNEAGGSFDIQTWHELPLAYTPQVLIFFAFLAAFAVKVPMWPVHTWLPDAHVEAPTGGSVVLAAIMLKLGAYGFLRLSLPIVPDASVGMSGIIIALSHPPGSPHRGNQYSSDSTVQISAFRRSGAASISFRFAIRFGTSLNWGRAVAPGIALRVHTMQIVRPSPSTISS